MLVFLGGVALLGLVFRECFRLFSIPVDQALGIKAGKQMDLAATGSSFLQVFFRVLLLLLMSVIASMIASRGIHLYSQSLNPVLHPPRRGRRKVHIEEEGLVEETNMSA